MPAGPGVGWRFHVVIAFARRYSDELLDDACSKANKLLNEANRWIEQQVDVLCVRTSRTLPLKWLFVALA